MNLKLADKQTSTQVVKLLGDAGSDTKRTREEEDSCLKTEAASAVGQPSGRPAASSHWAGFSPVATGGHDIPVVP